MSPAFTKAVALILKHEGGYVDDPRDPGGETHYGISKRAYPNENIRAMTPQRAALLYHRDYWQAIQGDALPYPLALITFDMAVNAGVTTATKMLQKALKVPSDGQIGPQTLAAAQAAPFAVAIRLSRHRITYYASLGGWQFYANSWTQRTLETLVAAKE